MATAHIYYDLKAAILFEGVGTDATWACIGEVVNDAGKKHGRALTNFFNWTGIRLENTGKIDPQFMRTDMREAVKRYRNELSESVQFQNDDPLRGLAGTGLMPWLLPKKRD